MITKVVGKCNSIDIVFNRLDGDKWETLFPINPKGEYIIELWATNDRDVTSYFATIRFSYDPKTLSVKFDILDVGTNFTAADVNALFGVNNVSANWKIGER